MEPADPDISMSIDEIFEGRLKRFGSLVKLCISERATYNKAENQNPNKFSHRLFHAETDQQFCAIFAAETQTIKAFSKFADLDVIDTIAGIPIPDSDRTGPDLDPQSETTTSTTADHKAQAKKDSARYLTEAIHSCETLVTGEIIETVTQKFKDRIARYASHYSLKLTNSFASGGPLFATTPHDSPHFHGRLLFAKGMRIPIDYSSLGTEPDGNLNQALVFYETGTRTQDGMLPHQHRFPALRHAFDTALKDTVNTPSSKIKYVDHRLRQILIERNGTFHAVTPVGSGPVCDLIATGIREIEQKKWQLIHAIERQAVRENRAQLSDDRNKKIKMTLIGNGVISNETGMKDLKKTESFSEDQDAEIIRSLQHLAGVRTSKLTFPAGGSKPRNVTRFGTAIQSPLFFGAPAKPRGDNQYISFLARGYRPHIQRKHRAEYISWLVNARDYLRNSETIKAVTDESKVTPLRNIVRDALDRARHISEACVNESESANHDNETPINRRPLDRLIEAGITSGPIFKQALAKAITRSLAASKEVATTDQKRLYHSIQLILESLS